MDQTEQDELIIYNTDDGKADVKLYSKDGVIWMNQQQMALLFDTSKQLISQHIANVLQEKELYGKFLKLSWQGDESADEILSEIEKVL